MLRNVLIASHLSVASTSRSIPPPLRTIWTWRVFKRWQDGEKEEALKVIEDRMTRVYGAGGMYLSAENDRATINRPIDDQTRQEKGQISVEYMSRQQMLRYVDWSPRAIQRYLAHERMVTRQFDQRYIAERHLYLGADLAAAHFLVHRGAAVKFVGDDTWYKRNERGEYSLPGVKVPGLYLEAIDASGTELMWEGMDNMVDLDHLRLLRLSDCPYVDDWMLSKMPLFAKSLELLDLSNCPKVTARGLTALAPLKRLRSVRLDNVGQSTARASKEMGKVALMLEECIDGLSVSGVDYDRSLEAVDAEHLLASHKRVVEDALGSLHAVDDNGHLYNVGGSRIDALLERSCVDDWDRPIMTSNIRRDVPAMPIADLLLLDRLSRHRIKHLLLGSASSVHWNEDIEHVLGFNAALNDKDGADTPTFLLPDGKLRARLEAEGDADALAQLVPPTEEEVDVRRRLQNGVERRLISAVEQQVAKRVAHNIDKT